MMTVCKRLVAVVLTVIMIVSALPLYTVSAASTYYQTAKANVPIWSAASSKSTKVTTIASSGTVLIVVGSTVNSSGNTWYQLNNGNWVFKDNVTKHSHSYTGGICSNNTCRYQWPYSVSSASGTYVITNKDGGKIWSRPYSKNSQNVRVAPYNSIVTVSGKTENQEGNTWYRLTDGNWVYSGNIAKHSHSYTGGICNNSYCNYQWPYTVTSASGTYVITNKDGAKIWSRPYSNRSTHVRTAAYNSTVTVSGKTENQEGNTWYKLSDGNWVYSGNITRRYTVSFNANGGKSAPSSQYVLKGKTLTLSSKKPTRVGYVFKGWATSSGSSTVKYSPGKSYSFSGNTTLYAVWKTCSHSYSGGICKTCGYEYGLKISDHSATYVVTKKDGAKIWSRPYSTNSTNVRRATYKSVLKVVAKTDNQEGNTWYQLSDGNWVFKDNVTRRYTVSYKSNGGKSAPSAQYVLKGKTLTISSTKPTRVGYVFQGWATSSSATTVKYKAGKSYSFSGNTTLYAVWKKCSHSYNGGICKTCGYEYKLKVSEYSATYVVTKKDGAKIWSRPYSTNSTNMRRVTYKSVLKVVAKTDNQEGNTWYQLSDGNWVYADNVTRRYTITYNANNGKGAPSVQCVLKGKSLTITSKKPTRIGYVFQGWATSANSKAVQYKPGKSYSFTASKTLYAVWSVCPHQYNTKGICTTCKQEKPFSYESLTKRVYKVTVSTATANTYSRPFKGCVTDFEVADDDLIQVIGVATVESSKWYHLSNDSWIPASKVTYYAKYSNGKLVYASTAHAKKVTTVATISQDTTPAEKYLKKKVGTIGSASLIPGLMKTVTRTKDGKTVTTCTGMVPQGLTFAGDYLLISAYCGCGAKHRSVIYVLDSANRRYQTTLILDDICHVGGLAKQGDYVWVCDTGTDDNKEKKLRAYSYSDIQNAVNVGANYWTLEATVTPTVKVTPSYICSANGYLYVGTHHKNSSTATIHYYSVSGTTIKRKGSFTIDGIKQLQGIAIRGKYMVVTSSLGRKNWDNSTVYVFKDTAKFKSDSKTYYKEDAKMFEFANMVEGCYIGSSYTYFICESGAKTYRESSFTRPLDKYVGFKNSVFGIS